MSGKIIPVEGVHLKKSSVVEEHFPHWLENAIIFVIVLVVIHTLIDDLSVVLGWSHDTLILIMILGFIFDLFFTIEFTARSIITGRRGQFGHYFKQTRGWIDFLSSVPLLLLVSGPAFVAWAFDFEPGSVLFGFFTVLKTIKAIRVTRILRLLRVIKLFGKLQNTDSVMTGRHVGTISTIAVVSLVFVLAIVEFVPGLRFGNHDDYYQKRNTQITGLLTPPSDVSVTPLDPAWLKYQLDNNPEFADVVKVNKEGMDTPLYLNKRHEEMKWSTYPPGMNIVVGEYTFIISYHAADVIHSRVNIIILIGILFIIGGMMLLYTPIFASQVADPVFIMDRGLREMEYNLEVKLDSEHVDDEIYKLARAYNVRWLTLKNQIVNYRKKNQKEGSVLKIDDLY